MRDTPAAARATAFALRAARRAYGTSPDPESIFTSHRRPGDTPCQTAATLECRCRALARHLLQYFRRALGSCSYQVFHYRQPSVVVRGTSARAGDGQSLELLVRPSCPGEQ